MYDVVYILKHDVEPQELKYSLRSVGKNFPHGKIWFFCGCPKGIKPDVYVPFEQTGTTKWSKATSTYRKICDSDVTENFWLFNDDFFILEKITELPYMYKGTLKERIDDLKARRGNSSYCMNLEGARLELESFGYDSLDYALHVPMLINKTKALETLNTFKSPMFRSLYGNYAKVGGIKTDDVKIYSVGLPTKGQTLLSTSDMSFRNGQVGKYIRDRFTEPSRWEII
jgi:hypothetical protein